MKPNQTKPNHIYLIYMYKEDLALDNLQWLICHKTKRNETFFFEHVFDLVVKYSENFLFRNHKNG